MNKDFKNKFDSAFIDMFSKPILSIEELKAQNEVNKKRFKELMQNAERTD